MENFTSDFFFTFSFFLKGTLKHFPLVTCGLNFLASRFPSVLSGLPQELNYVNISDIPAYFSDVK